MKKNLFYLGMLLIATLMINGCDKGDDGKSNDDGKTNYIEYNGKSHSIKNAWQVFYGHYYGDNSNNITLQFLTDEHYVTFEMFVSNSNIKLLTGVYEPSDGLEPYTVAQGLVRKGDGTVVYAMTTATIKIKVEGNVYNIEIEGKLENNTNVKGKFSGQLEWLDESDDDDEDGGSMTIAGDGSPQIIAITPGAQQIRFSTATRNAFMVKFLDSFMVNFEASNLTATMLPAGVYSISTATPNPTGTAYVSMNIPGVSGTVHANSGSFNVQKDGSVYNITFSFTTNTTPTRTVTGHYHGTISLYQ